MADFYGDPVFTLAPDDDAGALAQDRFRYQVELATARCVTMLVEDSIVLVVCEWHEDYVVQFRTSESELVSVKHLEPSQRRWTIVGICADGGLRHLFERWRKVKERCRCRLQTNAGLTKGEGNPGALAAACSGGLAADLQSWTTVLRPLLGAVDESEVLRFLEVLQIESELPDRHTIATVHVDAVMRPALRQLGIDERDADRLYQRLRNVVAAASRASDPHDFAAALTDPDQLGQDATLRQRLQAKTIDRPRALEALQVDRTRPRVLLSAPAVAGESKTRLVKKLAQGGLGGTGLRSAARLRANWLWLERQWAIDLPGGQAELENLRAYVLHLVSQVERTTRTPGGSYAAQMQDAVERTVTVAALGFDPQMPVTDHHLLGLVYDRTEACEVWWSDEFDVDGTT